MNLQDYTREAFAPVALPPDPPGMPPRAHYYQTPSDRMRDKAAEFAKLLIGLVPDPAYHTVIVDVLHDLVVGGEQALQAVLEGSPEWKASGSTLAVARPPQRTVIGITVQEIAAMGTELERLRDEAAKAAEQATPQPFDKPQHGKRTPK